MPLHPQLDEMIHRVLPVVQDFHRKAMFAPHAATIDASGELSGHTLTTDSSTSLSVAQAIEHFESKFSLQAQSREIQAMGIFYHSLGIDGSVERFSLPPANIMDECRTVVALLEHSSGDSAYLVIPYSGSPPQIDYGVGMLIEKPSKVFIRTPNPEHRPWWKLW